MRHRPLYLRLEVARLSDVPPLACEREVLLKLGEAALVSLHLLSVVLHVVDALLRRGCRGRW